MLHRSRLLAAIARVTFFLYDLVTPRKLYLLVIRILGRDLSTFASVARDASNANDANSVLSVMVISLSNRLESGLAVVLLARK